MKKKSLSENKQVALVNRGVDKVVAYAEKHGLCFKAQLEVARQFDWLSANRVFVAVARTGCICQRALKMVYGW